MALSVVMPALELAQDTGKLLSWRKKEGETVRKGEPLAEIETDKAVVEVEAPGDGILSAVTAREGAVIPVGHTIAWLLQPGETAPDASATGSGFGVPGSGFMVPGSQAPGTSDAERPNHGTANLDAAAPNPNIEIRVSPKARRLAKERGVDLTTIKGSGPGGEIVADDIPDRGAESPAPPESRAVQPAGAPRPLQDVARPFQGRDQAPKSPAPQTPISKQSAISNQESAISSAARLMAERTTQSWTTVPHFFLSRDVDATALNAMREAMTGITHTDLLVALVARALKKHPRLNSGSADVNVAIAIAVEDAVVTGVIHRADASSLAGIASRRKELSERARAGTLQPADISGATFTISNLGMYRVDAFTAIIVPPQAGILAVGAIADRVVAVNGQPAVRPMMTLTLSCDHRVVDGARGAAFLNDVVDLLKQA